MLEAFEIDQHRPLTVGRGHVEVIPVTPEARMAMTVDMGPNGMLVEQGAVAPDCRS